MTPATYLLIGLLLGILASGFTFFWLLMADDRRFYYCGWLIWALASVAGVAAINEHKLF